MLEKLIYDKHFTDIPYFCLQVLPKMYQSTIIQIYKGEDDIKVNVIFGEVCETEELAYRRVMKVYSHILKLSDEEYNALMNVFDRNYNDTINRDQISNYICNLIYKKKSRFSKWNVSKVVVKTSIDDELKIDID